MAISKSYFTVLVVFLVLNCFPNHLKSEAKVVREEFSGEVVSDMKVNLPAEAVWEVKYISGDGGLGTVSNITLQPAFGSTNWLEKLIVFDSKTMTRVVRQIKGGNLDSGFTVYDSGFRAIKKSKNSCVIRIFTPFQIKPESVSNASALTPNWGPTTAIVNYIISKKI